MKIKKEFIDDIYSRKKRFEIRNSLDKEGVYKIKDRSFYLKLINYDNYDNYDSYFESVFVNHLSMLNEILHEHNNANCEDSLDTKTYLWVKENEDYFKEESVVALYEWIEISYPLEMKELKAVY